MELDKNNMKKIAFLIAFAIAFYMGLQNLYLVSNLFNAVISILLPILLGFAFAFIVNVLMIQVETKLFAPLNKRYKKNWVKARRPLSILVSLLIIFGVIALILLIVIPELVNTITNLTTSIPPFLTQLQNNLIKLSNKHPYIGEYIGTININWTNISQMLATYMQNIGTSLVNSTVTITTGVFHGAMTLVLSFVIMLNILVQKEKLEGQAKRVFLAYLPKKFTDPFFRLCRLTTRAFSNFIAGQLTEACILATLCFIGMNIFGFPYALLISVFVAFMALIPIIGAFLSTVVGGLLISIVSPIQAIGFVIFFVVLQQLEGNFIFPRVVGSKVGLPGLWVLIAVTIGGNMFGVIGMIVNIPLCSVLYMLLRENVNKRLAKPEEIKEE
jgi:predicted PurR-regulated permease PerM